MGNMLLDELYKMDLREKCKIKTKYSKNDMQEEWMLNKQEYLSKVNSLNNEEATRKNRY